MHLLTDSDGGTNFSTVLQIQGAIWNIDNVEQIGHDPTISRTKLAINYDLEADRC